MLLFKYMSRCVLLWFHENPPTHQHTHTHYEFRFFLWNSGKSRWMTAGGVSNKPCHDGTRKLVCHFAEYDSRPWHIIEELRKTHEGRSRITEAKTELVLRYVPTLQLAPALLNKHKDGRSGTCAQPAGCVYPAQQKQQHSSGGNYGRKTHRVNVSGRTWKQAAVSGSCMFFIFLFK